jgi:hypothetical protein
VFSGDWPRGDFWWDSMTARTQISAVARLAVHPLVLTSVISAVVVATAWTDGRSSFWLAAAALAGFSISGSV